MLSIKKIIGKGYKIEDYQSFEYHLLIDGKEADKTTVKGSFIGSEPEEFDIYSDDIEVSKKLLEYKWGDFPKLRQLALLIDSISEGFENRLFIEKDFHTDSFFVNLYFNPNLQNWKNIYSYQDFEKAIGNESKNLADKNIVLETWNTNEELTVEFKTNLVLENKSLLENLNQFIENCFNIYKRTVTNLITDSEEVSIYLNFDFPEKIKIPCKQYLLYFAQFLQDLGINATSNLKEEAGIVLFSVTPTNSFEALDKIREAVAVYLNLPSSPIVYDESFAAMRLQQQIENLQHSQKMVAREMQLTEKLVIAQSEIIQEKNIIISQKDSIIEQQNKVIEKITSKSIMIDSLENKEELEDIYDGLKIGESKFLKEQLGIHFNPAKVIKTGVNNLFGKGDEVISILDSDEETEKNS